MCTHGDVRLVGGSSQYDGKVELCFYGTWDGVCGFNFDIYDAAVVCRQLGHQSVGM